jgi:hypothetical protein
MRHRCLAGEVVDVVEACVGRFGRFRFMAPEEIPVLARLEPAIVMFVGFMTLLEASSRSSCVHPPWFYSGGKPQILGIGRWRRLFASFSSLGPSSQSRLCLGTGDGGRVAKVAVQGRCRQFGNDDAASGVWVTARAWLVCLRRVR